MLRPEYKEFLRLAREATLVPVVKSVMADLMTPVSAFLAISRAEKDAFLLESAERGVQIGRYTFLGARPYRKLQARGSKVTLEDGRKRTQREGNIFQIAKQLLEEHKPAV
ncbi:MAG: anthranilate synthase component I, partial [Acidobacteria bacterium]|nr:anthranilate synthase component I [Acidobacteriota bacterium]